MGFFPLENHIAQLSRDTPHQHLNLNSEKLLSVIRGRK